MPHVSSEIQVEVGNENENENCGRKRLIYASNARECLRPLSDDEIKHVQGTLPYRAGRSKATSTFFVLVTEKPVIPLLSYYLVTFRLVPPLVNVRLAGKTWKRTKRTNTLCVCITPV